MTDATIDVQIALDDTLDLPTRDDLARWARAALARHPAVARSELTIRLVSLDESRSLNRDYRHKDSPTNVLSFPFEAPPGLELPLLGDLAICHAVVAREAQEQHKPLTDHYAHMVVHGTLHLLGYDHMKEADADEMEALERDILAAMGIGDPYVLSGTERGSYFNDEDTRPDA
ncbi:probable rRNA maturation factor [Modicisalibacter ilicicola DSM 19980]|uniref:Endoribonuclease YbeY n=1 Tax=Modicisalibacter ilicicola DSM 19980 TaxID=1121942 RepID=A0A1M4X2L0_9GAMM|nr:rRNA maturation RNase YbeY [Halomonas ilicicola]SHE87748.1 probable rRNA maturation factor [Halomonas ilicicola DSM 19980]